jgi:uncharacterized protein YgbK (DUF1537 family)
VARPRTARFRSSIEAWHAGMAVLAAPDVAPVPDVHPVGSVRSRHPGERMSEGLHLALKSGNFGAEEFFAKAFACLT